MKILPLNGKKTHPLSEHALLTLDSISREPVPTNEVNAGVINRLMRDKLVTIIELPSPYKTHKVKCCNHLAITEEGRAVLQQDDHSLSPR